MNKNTTINLMQAEAASSSSIMPLLVYDPEQPYLL